MPKLKASQTQEENKHVVVVGTSAGGLSALIKLTSQMQKDFDAPILVVQHISADATGNVLLEALRKNSNLICEHAINGTKLQSGHLYLAPSDHHLMIADDEKMLVTKGAMENRSRPAIDPLFRSAAVAFGNRTIGVLLTGYLDDGTAGLTVIKKCGGICIVQDPAEADYPDMPQNALNQIKIDYCLPIAQMGVLLSKLLSRKPGKRKPIPLDISIEADIAMRVLSDLPSVNALGKQVPFNCPGCGGVLWLMNKSSSLRYRCHTGHAYTAASLLAEQSKKIEETMWTALRMFEERKNLLTTIAEKEKGAAGKSALERANLSQVHIDRIRALLQVNDKGTSSDTPI
ncbi:Chemotaxis response regulator protein-glutamate methylesterase CheB [Arcticibacter svalbardensis MN12-7]|uniref:protein-glutamate methylesterase n=1 Tax=Arcticibacter svalbardensis MN12-7 TaxID=1150600 RepID=R9GTP1_9SPHI|nr:chemotaxis protein CheB [Arcticibacter svalbardensis]EOR95058.1 Chemotaxis response regulator protein-glutamate methylesterase CheB [Arcticibacter svalbardensis MN12-7]